MEKRDTVNQAKGGTALDAPATAQPLKGCPNPSKVVRKRVYKAIVPQRPQVEASNAYTNPNRPIGPNHRGGFERAQNMSTNPLNNAATNPNSPRGPR